MSPSANRRVRAAGGVIERDGAVLLVHRPRYDDWTFPKGKAHENERFEDCALREVLEETGFHCRRLRELESSHYTDSRGRPKIVRYWLMEILDGEFRPGDEVDEIRWSSPSTAAALLSYDRDRALLASIAE